MHIKNLFFIAILFASYGFNAQTHIGYLVKDLPGDTLLASTPAIIYPVTGPLQQITTKSGLVPLVDVVGGGTSAFVYKGRGGINFYRSSKKRCLRAGFLAGFSPFDSLYHQNDWLVKKSRFSIDPMVRFSYQPNTYLNVQMGWDRNFYGEGLRSLFLSDYGRSCPFVSTKFSAGPLRYQAMALLLKTTSFQYKFNFSHFLDWKITKSIHFQFFESVVFNSHDTLSNRPFEVSYLNPLAFIRPKEYAIGSGDNVIMGIGGTVKIGKGLMYSQFVLDEFLLSALKNNSRYWGNKYGFQLGYKIATNKGKWKMFYRIETNGVRPYTYSHIGDQLSYSHGSMALAHPMGSNFQEGLLESKGTYKSVFYNATVIVGQKGVDSTFINYGNNILLPYTTRPQDYNVYFFQGVSTRFVHVQLQLGYQFKRFENLEIFAEILLRASKNSLGSSFTMSPLIGIRTFLWNDYRNY